MTQKLHAEPSSLILFAALLMLAGNILCRLIHLLFGAHLGLAKDKNAQRWIRRGTGFIYTCFFIPCAFISFILGIRESWHVGHVGGVVIGIGAALFYLATNSFLKSDDEDESMRNRFAWQRRNLLTFMNIAMALVLFMNYSYCSYPQPGRLYVILICLVFTDLLIIKPFEIFSWRRVGVDITGKADGPPIIETATENEGDEYGPSSF